MKRYKIIIEMDVENLTPRSSVNYAALLAAQNMAVPKNVVFISTEEIRPDNHSERFEQLI